MDQTEQMNVQNLMGVLEDIQGGMILCQYDRVTKRAKATYANRGWTDISGYTMQQFQAEKGGDLQSLIFAADRERIKAEFVRQSNRGRTYALMFRIVHRSGALRWVIAKGTMRPMTDGKVHIQSILTEVTEIKEREERMALLAQTDQLTGLTNKATFALLAQTTLNRRGECRHALLILDIDGFKNVNDNYGHAFGDKVLAAVAERLKHSFRSSDIVGRVGGDEFMVLMTDVSCEEVVLKKTRELCADIRRIRILGEEHAPITMSIGISFFRGDKAYEPLFSEADAALYRAKGNGKDQCVHLHGVWLRMRL